MEPHLPLQPPPDASAPPPGPEAIRSKFKMRLILALGGLCLGVFLFTLLDKVWTQHHYDNYYRTRAIKSTRKVHLALTDFDKDYGRFPDATTAAAVKAATGTSLSLGNTFSNDLFLQLFAVGHKDEYSFSVFGWGKVRGADDVIGTNANTLVPGECDLTYIAGLSSKDDPGTPLLIVPVIHGTWKFDPGPFGGKAVVLRLDGSASLETIDKHGDVVIGGMNFFDPRQPYWHGKAPDLKWPK